MSLEISSLPPEIQFRILEILPDFHDLSVCCRVCKLWNALVPFTKLWKEAFEDYKKREYQKYIKEFQTLPFLALGSNPSTSILEAKKHTQIFDIGFFEGFSENLCTAQRVLFNDPNLVLIANKNDGEGPYPLYAFVYDMDTGLQHNFELCQCSSTSASSSSFDKLNIVIVGDTLFLGYNDAITEFDIPSGKETHLYIIKPLALQRLLTPPRKNKFDKMSYVVSDRHICSCVNYFITNQTGEEIPYTNITVFSRFDFRTPWNNETLQIEKGCRTTNEDTQGKSSSIYIDGLNHYYITTPPSEEGDSCYLACRNLKTISAVEHERFPSKTAPESFIVIGDSILAHQKNSISSYSLSALEHQWTHLLPEEYTVVSIKAIRDKVFIEADSDQHQAFQMLSINEGKLEAEFSNAHEIEGIINPYSARIAASHISGNHLAMIVDSDSTKIVIQEFPDVREREAAEDEPQPKRQKVEDLA